MEIDLVWIGYTHVHACKQHSCHPRSGHLIDGVRIGFVYSAMHARAHTTAGVEDDGTAGRGKGRPGRLATS